MKNSVEVYFANRHVGTIARLNNKYAFQYSESWLKDGFSISPFSLPLKKELFISNKEYFEGLFGVFGDSLPDAWGRLLVDRYLKKNGIKDIDPLLRLTYINSDGMGALEYRPQNVKKEEISFSDFHKLQLEINDLFNKKDVDVKELFFRGGSSGGARPKIYININNEDWIIKFNSRFDRPNSGVIEYEYAKACQKIGINIPEVKLIDNVFFAVKRFDRLDGKKIHMISCAALLEVDYRTPCLDYSDLFKLTKILTNDNKEDIENLFLRMCFNVYAHNKDDHAKNFSFIYDEKNKKYRLSPSYDMTYSDTYYNEQTTSCNGKGNNILDEDLIKVGLKAGIKLNRAETLLNKVKKCVEEDLRKYLI